MERQPTYTFTVPADDLDEEKMKEEWHNWFITGHYNVFGANCCWVVYKILRAGGAPISATILWRPENLRRYLVTYLGGGWKITTFFNLPFFA